MRYKVLLAAVLAATVFSSPVLAHDAGAITLQGRGEISAQPDTAYLNSGVSTQGATAREALDSNSAAIDELIKTLKAAGIEDRDIQTSGFSVSPNYVYTDARDENGYTLPPKVVGYIVSNQVTVRVRDLLKLGEVIDKAVTVGANTINGVTFSLADPSSVNDEARRAAFADAQDKAKVYAETAGLELGNITAINEATDYYSPMPYMAREAAADMAAVPIATGELVFSIAVNVTWEIDD